MSETAALSRGALARHGARAIAQGSKSFALASLFFDRAMQADVQMLYAWCRHCDDVIDGQSFGEDAPDAALTADEQRMRLDDLRRNVERALAGERTGDPAFDGFAAVAAKVEMPRQYPFDLLDGFAMDADRRRYATLDDTLEYCYGVAGAVGVMMAIVMGVPRDDEATLDRACDLGLAFQLTNICRDVVDDAKAGRIYLPADALARLGVDASPAAIGARANRAAVAAVASDLLDVADGYYASAAAGMRRLPLRAAAAVAAARNIYRDIGVMIRVRGESAWDERVFTSRGRKSWLALLGVLQGVPQPLLLRSRAPTPRGALWRRPRAARA